MNIIRKDGKLEIMQEKQIRNEYIVNKGSNKRNFVERSTVCSDILHVVEGNSKTGKHVINFNFPIEYTCTHCCECYKNATCYAESGCYLFADNQAGYSENFNFYKTSTKEEFCKALQIAIDYFGFSLFRYFTCGDIPDSDFLSIMVEMAINNPAVKFWSYTKKYEIVNKWIDKNGDLPENLTIVFSHWMNDDGSYFPMNNRHNMPTSEYIPLGKEELKETVDYICPCSDPSVIATCETCDHPCYKLKKGEKQALLEHSTTRTKERDKAIKTAKNALKNA